MKHLVLVLCMLWVGNLLSSSEGADSLGNSDSPASGAVDAQTVNFF